MATDPGDLVLDPTCGSGTAATVAEQWGTPLDHHRHLPRRPCPRAHPADGGEIPLLPARRQPRGPRQGAGCLRQARQGDSPGPHNDVRHGFVYERAPHVTLKSIANNAEIDVLWEEAQAKLEPLRGTLNAALGQAWEEWQIPRDA